MTQQQTGKGLEAAQPCARCQQQLSPGNKPALPDPRASISSAKAQTQRPYLCSLLAVNAAALTAKLQMPTFPLRSTQLLHTQYRFHNDNKNDASLYICKFCASQCSLADFDKDRTFNKYQNPDRLLFHLLTNGIFFCSETAS